MTARNEALRRQLDRKARALQADDDSYGGILETDEPNEAPAPCAGWDPDQDGDDDSCPQGDLDHSHWNEDGEQIQAVPGRPLMPVDQGKVVSASLRRPRQQRILGRVPTLFLRQAPGSPVYGDQMGTGPALPSSTGDVPSMPGSMGEPDRVPQLVAAACTLRDRAAVLLAAGDQVGAAEALGELNAVNAALADALGVDIDAGETDGRSRGGCGCTEHRWGGPNVETRWDGPAAMSACANSDTPASCYGSICAGRRAGDPSEQSTWALPHHAHPGAPPDPQGVHAALAALHGGRGGVQGLTNRDAAEEHLRRHAAAMEPDAGGLGGRPSGAATPKVKMS